MLTYLGLESGVICLGSFFASVLGQFGWEDFLLPYLGLESGVIRFGGYFDDVVGARIWVDVSARLLSILAMSL